MKFIIKELLWYLQQLELPKVEVRPFLLIFNTAMFIA